MIVILTEQIKKINAQDIFHLNVYNFVTFHYIQLGFFIEREILLRKIDWTGAFKNFLAFWKKTGLLRFAVVTKLCF